MEDYIIRFVKVKGESVKHACLCSEDLKPGDKVVGTILGDENVYISERNEQGYMLNIDKHLISLDEARIMDGLKEVAFVSPNAEWVEGGMRVKEEDVRIFVIDPEDSEWKADYYDKADWSEELELGFIIVAEIRCPTCKTFH